MEKIIILGNGGHARSMADTIEREGKYQIAGYVTNEKKDKSTDYPIIGNDDDLFHLYREGIHAAAMGIGYMGKGDLRKRLYEKLKKIGYCLPVICDPTAIISDKVEIEEGCFIGKRSVINVNARIGRMSIINSGAIVEHDCKVGAFSHVAVGSILCGGVWVGEETFVGANATVIQNVNVAPGCIIGAGEVIKKDIPTKRMVTSGRKNVCDNLL